MAIIKHEITSLRDVLDIELRIPSYQRPYRWSAKSCNILFQDLLDAFKSGINEYRVGTIILRKDNNNYDVVDGQQRLTTLSILLYCLNQPEVKLLSQSYSSLSDEAIIRNYEVLAQNVNELAQHTQNDFINFLKYKCELVKIVTDDEQEAFQFFDSQNSRGKALAPHDLLKAYHLREMNNESEELKIGIINRWESYDQTKLANLFKNYLFPLTQWYKGRNGLDYSTKKIDIFKGIKSNNTNNFAIYHKASNLYIEQINSSGATDLLSSNHLNQFQLTQPIVAGKRFFHYTMHYKELLKKVEARINNSYKKEERPDLRTGDAYIKELFECVLMFFVDKFGFESLNDSILQILYKWCYSLRLVMSAVYLQTINKYALGKHDVLNSGLHIFNILSEINSPEELKLYHLDSYSEKDKKNTTYGSIRNQIHGNKK